MQNQIEYQEGYTPNTLEDTENFFTFGKGWSYGGLQTLANVPAKWINVDCLRSSAVRGVMAVAPREGDPSRAFAALTKVAESVRLEYPGAVVISAGMSSDLEAAITNGSTCVRVGTALFGPREPAHH